MGRYNLYIGTYNGTAILELLYFNVPTVIFWENNEISKLSLPYFEQLNEAGIFHNNFEEAADFVNNNFSTIENWWNSEVTQKARQNFCNQYCREIKSPIKALSGII